MNDNLDTLRKTAETATPGPWRIDKDSEQDYEQGIPYSEWPQTLVGPKNIQASQWAIDHGEEFMVDEINELGFPDAEFIATFDPPTVLALLSRLEQAEQQVQAVLRLADSWETGALRWEDPLRVPNEVFLLRKALHQPTHEPDWTDYQLGDPGASCSCGYNGPYKECWQSRRALDGETDA